MYRIAFIGPESTAKSTLCEQLANYLHAKWIHEFSRDYIQSLNRPYTKADVEYCIKMQVEADRNAIGSEKEILLTDNEAINGLVWMLDKYNEAPLWIEEEIMKNPYDLYLLTYPDIEFVADQVRENEGRRMYFYNWYKSELDKRNLNYAVIKGLGDERFQNVLTAVQNFLSEKKV